MISGGCGKKSHGEMLEALGERKTQRHVKRFPQCGWTRLACYLYAILLIDDTDSTHYCGIENADAHLRLSAWGDKESDN